MPWFTIKVFWLPYDERSSACTGPCIGPRAREPASGTCYIGACQSGGYRLVGLAGSVAAAGPHAPVSHLCSQLAATNGATSRTRAGAVVCRCIIRLLSRACVSGRADQARRRRQQAPVGVCQRLLPAPPRLEAHLQAEPRALPRRRIIAASIPARPIAPGPRYGCLARRTPPPDRSAQCLPSDDQRQLSQNFRTFVQDVA